MRAKTRRRNERLSARTCEAARPQWLGVPLPRWRGTDRGGVAPISRVERFPLIFRTWSIQQEIQLETGVDLSFGEREKEGEIAIKSLRFVIFASNAIWIAAPRPSGTNAQIFGLRRTNHPEFYSSFRSRA